jgi:hypothetical protein
MIASFKIIVCSTDLMLCLGSLWQVLAGQRASQLLFHLLLVSLTTINKQQCSKRIKAMIRYGQVFEQVGSVVPYIRPYCTVADPDPCSLYLDHFEVLDSDC